MKKIYWFMVLPITGLSLAASGQLAPAPVSIENTMKFIGDKISEQDKFGYLLNSSDLAGVTFRTLFDRPEVLPSSSTCDLHTVGMRHTDVEVAQGTTYSKGGKPVTDEDLHSREGDDVTVSFKDVESVEVESLQDHINGSIARSGHPERSVTITPGVFLVALSASKPIFLFHHTWAQGNQPAREKDVSGKEVDYIFADEAIADRVSNAMTHAMELCGGGNKDPF